MTEAKKASLTVLGGPLAGSRCVLPDAGVVTIGSEEGSGLLLELPGVGPLHAQVVVAPGSVSVYEEGGYRVFVNDSPVGEEGTLLHNGDVVWLGSPGDDDAVMLQCLLPRRPVEQPVAAPAPGDSEAVSPEATLAAIPLPAETFITEPTSDEAPQQMDASFALLPEEEQAETVVLQGDSGEELVFAVDGAPAAAAEPVYGEPVYEPIVEAEPVPDDSSGSGPHVVVPDFESAVFVEPEAITEAEPAEPVAPPPLPAPKPHAPAAPRPSPDATHPPRPPHATHPPQGHPPYATLPAGKRARKGRSGGRGAMIAAGGFAAIVVLALGWAGWKYVWPRFSSPSSETPPVAVAEPTPRPIETAAAVPSEPTPEPSLAPSPVATPLAASPMPTPAATPSPTPRTTPSPSPRATPTPRTTPTPRATPTPASARGPAPPTTVAAGPSPASQAQALVGQAEAALAARQFEAAIGHADAALRLDPGNARATALRADATSRRDLARRRFAPGRTAVQTQKAGNSNLSGFDAGGADVRKAPDFQGRIEFEMSPSSGIDAGESWRLRIFVVNDGKKAIRVQGLTVTTNVNGAGGGVTLSPLAREVAPQQRALVGETSGSWREGTTSWTSEVAVTANKGDSLRNTLTWR